jgi:hypothetical protein
MSRCPQAIINTARELHFFTAPPATAPRHDIIPSTTSMDTAHVFGLEKRKIQSPVLHAFPMVPPAIAITRSVAVSR